MGRLPHLAAKNAVGLVRRRGGIPELNGSEWNVANGNEGKSEILGILGDAENARGHARGITIGSTATVEDNLRPESANATGPGQCMHYGTLTSIFKLQV